MWSPFDSYAQAATQQHLYSSPTPSLGPFLGSTSNSRSSSSLRSFGGLSLTSSSHSSPKPASSSSRYDVTSSDVLSDDDDTDALHDIRTMKLTSSGRERRISDVKPFGQGGMDCRGFLNLLAVSMLLLTLVGVFAGLPIWSYLKEINSKPYGSEGVTVSSELDGKARGIPAYRGLIDKDTPEGVKTMQSFLERGKELKLVFSDEVRAFSSSILLLRRVGGLILLCGRSSTNQAGSLSPEWIRTGRRSSTFPLPLFLFPLQFDSDWRKH